MESGWLPLAPASALAQLHRTELLQMQCQFYACAWARLGRIVAWMTTLTNANVFAAGQRYKSKKDLHRAIRSAGIAAADTDVVANDYSEGAAFTIPTGNGAASTRARDALTPLRCDDRFSRAKG